MYNRDIVESIYEAAQRMTRLKTDDSFHPNLENKATDDQLYAEYARLQDYFGRSEDDVVKRLKKIRDAALIPEIAIAEG